MCVIESIIDIDDVVHLHVSVVAGRLTKICRALSYRENFA